MIFPIRFGLFSLFILLNGSWIQAQQSSPTPRDMPDEVLRVTTSLVTVPVTIKDRNGHPISNLNRNDFRLYEDGIEQEIVFFETPEKQTNEKISRGEQSATPLTVALLLDVSDSTEFKLKEIREAALAFVNELRTEDRTLVMSFDQNVRVLTTPTDDRAMLREAILHTRPGRGTSLYDAMHTVIEWLNRVSGRKAIVLLTDGVDTASAHATYEDTVRAAQKLDAAIYPIQFNTYGDFIDSPGRQTDSVGTGGTAHMTRSGELASEAYKRGTIYLRLLAEKTGGSFGYTDTLKNLGRSFHKIASTLREQYTLGFYPKTRAGESKERKLKVTVNVQNASVHSRRNYVLGSPNR